MLVYILAMLLMLLGGVDFVEAAAGRANARMRSAGNANRGAARLPDTIVHYDGGVGNGGLKPADGAVDMGGEGDQGGGGAGGGAAKGGGGVGARPDDWPDLPGPEDGSKRGQQVPYGKRIPRQKGTNYFVASGRQECNLCKQLIAEAEYTGRQYFDACGYLIRNNLNREMCAAQQRTLQSCPEFLNDWCYHDLGGTQQLLSPCPEALKCHYCLGLNPLHCL
jgi:hypothetical protein